MQKIITFLIMFLMFFSNSVKAESITKTIRSLGLNTDAISVSVKDVQSGQEVYSLNKNAPMTPASTLKLVTSLAALDTLGWDYNFSTKLYKSTNNDLYLVLGADPFLTSNDLESLIEAAKEKNIIEPKHFYIDDSIFDDVEWGEGWQWDDDLNPLMPKFSSYNLNSNLLRIDVIPFSKGQPASIALKPYYPITLMNLVTTNYEAGANNLKLERNLSIAPNVINVSGSVSKTNNLYIPVPNQRLYFKLRLEDAIRAKKMEYYTSFSVAKLPEKNVYLVKEITHDIDKAVSNILKDSNNMTAESLVKLAGAVYANSQGNVQNSEKMLQSYLSKLDILSSNIKIVDASGVSKNNIMTSDFMTKFLVAFYKDEYYNKVREYLPAPGEGTLKNRMLYFKDNLKAKTGTLSDTSAIAGYLKTRRGHLYAFDIMIKDAKTSSMDKKNIEEQILRQIYVNY
mgnify:CR=1 FL=1